MPICRVNTNATEVTLVAQSSCLLVRFLQKTVCLQLLALTWLLLLEPYDMLVLCRPLDFTVYSMRLVGLRAIGAAADL